MLLMVATAFNPMLYAGIQTTQKLDQKDEKKIAPPPPDLPLISKTHVENLINQKNKLDHEIKIYFEKKTIDEKTSCYSQKKLLERAKKIALDENKNLEWQTLENSITTHQEILKQKRYQIRLAHIENENNIKKLQEYNDNLIPNIILASRKFFEVLNRIAPDNIDFNLMPDIFKIQVEVWEALFSKVGKIHPDYKAGKFLFFPIPIELPAEDLFQEVTSQLALQIKTVSDLNDKIGVALGEDRTAIALKCFREAFQCFFQSNYIIDVNKNPSKERPKGKFIPFLIDPSIEQMRKKVQEYSESYHSNYQQKIRNEIKTLNIQTETCVQKIKNYQEYLGAAHLVLKSEYKKDYQETIAVELDAPKNETNKINKLIADINNENHSDEDRTEFLNEFNDLTEKTFLPIENTHVEEELKALQLKYESVWDFTQKFEDCKKIYRKNLLQYEEGKKAMRLFRNNPNYIKFNNIRKAQEEKRRKEEAFQDFETFLKLVLNNKNIKEVWSKAFVGIDFFASKVNAGEKDPFPVPTCIEQFVNCLQKPHSSISQSQFIFGENKKNNLRGIMLQAIKRKSTFRKKAVTGKFLKELEVLMQGITNGEDASISASEIEKRIQNFKRAMRTIPNLNLEVTSEATPGPLGEVTPVSVGANPGT